MISGASENEMRACSELGLQTGNSKKRKLTASHKDGNPSKKTRNQTGKRTDGRGGTARGRGGTARGRCGTVSRRASTIGVEKNATLAAFDF